MRKHLSVFMLIARSSIYKTLLVLLAMLAAEALLIFFALEAGLSDGLEVVIDKSRVAWAFGAGFLLTSAALCFTGCEFGGKQGYTLRRLSVSERTVFLWQAVYNGLCFLVLWAVQLGAALAVCGLYLRLAAPSAQSGQTVFLAFYRNSFFHSLLPLEETSRLIRNIALVVGLGASTAYVPYRQRRGKPAVGAAALAVAGIWFFDREIGSFGNDMFMIILCAFVAAMSVYRVYGREAENEN